MGIVSSLASFASKSSPVTAGLAEFAFADGDKNFQAFQYFPETISDSRAPNYSSRPVPGGSHPIYTFIDGGERSISFDAIFTSDAVPEESKSDGLLGLLTGKKSIQLPFLKKERKDTVDIAAAIAWLRWFTYPSYGAGVAKAPPPCTVYLPKSGIIGAGGVEDSIVGIMTSCNVRYEAFHRNGRPRFAVVSLEFKEIVQVDKAWQFFGSDEPFFEELAKSYKRAMSED